VRRFDGGRWPDTSPPTLRCLQDLSGRPRSRAVARCRTIDVDIEYAHRGRTRGRPKGRCAAPDRHAWLFRSEAAASPRRRRCEVRGAGAKRRLAITARRRSRRRPSTCRWTAPFEAFGRDRPRGAATAREPDRGSSGRRAYRQEVLDGKLQSSGHSAAVALYAIIGIDTQPDFVWPTADSNPKVPSRW